MSSYQNDTKLVKVVALNGGYHPNTGGEAYRCAGLKLSKKFGGKTIKQPAVDRPHMTIRKVNVPDKQPASVLEGVPTKPGPDNPKVSFDVQKLPAVDDAKQAGAASVGNHAIL